MLFFLCFFAHHLAAFSTDITLQCSTLYCWNRIVWYQQKLLIELFLVAYKKKTQKVSSSLWMVYTDKKNLHVICATLFDTMLVSEEYRSLIYLHQILFHIPKRIFMAVGWHTLSIYMYHGLWKQKTKNQLTCWNANSISKIKSSWDMFFHLFFSNWLQLHCLFCLICMLSFCCNSSTPKSANM